MEKIIINIGASSNHFGAFSENCEGIYGSGDTPEEAKQNALDGLRLLVKTRAKDDLPKILRGEYEVEYHFDTQSLLQYYAGILNKATLERLTGINQKLLHHYASGIKTPRMAQRKKIETALHGLGRELLAVNL